MTALSRLTDWLSNRPTQPGPFETYATAALAVVPAQALAPVMPYPAGSFGAPVWPGVESLDEHGYRRLGLIYRCVNLIAHAAGTAPVRVYDESDDGAELPDHPLRRLLRQPNPHQGEALFWSSVVLRASVAGYCLIEKERSVGGEVIALWPLRSNWARAIERTGGTYDWEYRVPGTRAPEKLAAEDVIAIRWSDTPDGSPYGLSPLAVCVRDTALLGKMIDFLAVLFERGGVPMWGLIPNLLPGQSLSQAQVDAMTEGFLQRHGGLARSAIPTVLAGIKSVERLGFDLDELAYTDLRDVSELAIVQAFGVPATKAIIRVGLEHSDSRANAQVDDATFYRDTMVPLWTRFDDALTTGLLGDFEDLPTTIGLEFDTSEIEALQPNRNERAPWLIEGFSAGAWSQHALYRELGMPIPDTADFYMRSLAVRAIPAEDPLANPEPGPPIGLARDAPRQTLDRGPSSVQTLAATKRAAIGAHNRAEIARVADAKEPALARYFAGQKRRVVAAATAPVGIAALGSNGHSAHTLAVTDIDWDAESRLLRAVLMPLYAEAGEAAFAAAGEQIGVAVAWDLANPNVSRILDHLALRVVDITDTTRDDIRGVVDTALADGSDLKALASKLSDLYDETYAGRSMTIARTETMIGFGEASILGYQESGVVSEVMILDNPNHTDAYGASDGLTCAQRHESVWPVADAMAHIRADHPNGSATSVPIVSGAKG